MRIRRAPPSEEPSINLTPMVDMVFLLLTFFLLATTFLNPEKEMDLDLPSAVSGTEDAGEPRELVINVLRDGTVTLAGQALDGDGLLRELRRAAGADPDTQVTIRGDRKVYHEKIVDVMDACGQAGLARLAVSITEET